MKVFVSILVLTTMALVGYGFFAGVDAALEAFRVSMFLSLAALIVGIMGSWMAR